MIVKRFNRVGKISRPYYTQNNQQIINTELGKVRKKIEMEIGGTEPYDIYNMIADQAKRIDVLETIIKELNPLCLLNPRLDVDTATSIYNNVNKRMNDINNILNGEK